MSFYSVDWFLLIVRNRLLIAINCWTRCLERRKFWCTGTCYTFSLAVFLPRVVPIIWVKCFSLSWVLVLLCWTGFGFALFCFMGWGGTADSSLIDKSHYTWHQDNLFFVCSQDNHTCPHKKNGCPGCKMRQYWINLMRKLNSFVVGWKFVIVSMWLFILVFPVRFSRATKITWVFCVC